MDQPREPQMNGQDGAAAVDEPVVRVGGRSPSTLSMEQVVHGRIFQSIDDFRDAARDFVLRYNTQWLVEKNGHVSPADAPQRKDGGADSDHRAGRTGSLPPMPPSTTPSTSSATRRTL